MTFASTIFIIRLSFLQPTPTSETVRKLRECGPTAETASKVPANPTHGSGWIVQVQPTDEARSCVSPNPTHGSGWIVQVQPTDEARSCVSPNPTHGSGWYSLSV